MPAVKLHQCLVAAFISVVDDADRTRSDRVTDAVEPGDEDETAGYPLALKKPMKGWGIFELYRQRAEALAAAERGEEPKAVENQPPDLMEIYRRARQGYDSGQNTR